MNESEEMRGRLPQGMFTALRDELNMFLADPFLVDDDDDEIFEYICFLRRSRGTKQRTRTTAGPAKFTLGHQSCSRGTSSQCQLSKS